MISAQVDAQRSTNPRPVLDVNGDRARSSQPSRRPFLTILVSCLILGALGVGTYFVVMRLIHRPAAGASGLSAQGRPIPVVAAGAVKGDMNIYLTGLGTVTAYNTVTVRTRVDGQIMKVHFVEGQIIKEGNVLLEVDPRPYQVQLMQAQGQLLKDQSLLRNAQLDLQRYQSIKTSVTQQQIDTQASVVSQFQGAVESDQSQVDSAKLNLSYCQVTAPISGRIGLRLVDVGNIVHASDTNGLAVITQLQPIAVVFTVPEDQITDVYRRPDHGQGLVVDAFNRDLSQKIAIGKLLAIDNQVDPSTGTVRIKGEFANLNGGLFPNQFVNARLLVNTLKDVVLVPSPAVQLGPQSMTFAYVVKPDKTVELRHITVGPQEGGRTAIEEGIKPGEVVVTDGVDKLVPGSKVNVRMSDASGDQATTRPAREGRPGKAGPASSPAAVDAGAAK